jgi:cytochrome c nitrite reductase small subunit
MFTMLAKLNSATFLLCCFTGVFVGVGVYTFYYAQGAAYLSNDPKACANCHIMREHYDGWQKASHHAVATCNDCHVPHALLPKYLSKTENGFWHSKGFTLQDFYEPIRIRPRNLKTLNHNCASCHHELVSDIAATHGKSIEGLDCVRCHASVGHGPTR